MVPKADDMMKRADDTSKSDAPDGEAKGGCWQLEVEDDQRKLGW
jgi:subtilisin-like proprotein convertase family protein